MLLTYLMLGVALCLSAVAAFYSIVGLTAIFAAAVIPIIIMGSILEAAKLVVTVWLHEYWKDIKWSMKAYLAPAVFVLMVITSMGIFGFLSKAHLDQAVPTGDVAAQVALFDEKIRTQRENIEAARRALTQMDAAVDQTLTRSSNEQGADKASNLRRSQQRERTTLQNDIARAQAEITKLNEQKAPMAANLRKVEAEIGPIKYIAALIYGDNPDANLLEKAVRWVIIILVIVFDPLAIMMLLAATESYKWEKERRRKKEETDDTDVDDVKTVTNDLDRHDAGNDVPDEPVPPPLDQSELDSKIDLQNLEHQDQDDFPERNTLYVGPEKAKPDNEVEEEWQESEPDGDKISFGRVWPRDAHRGDLFVKINTLPTALYKFNGEKWIEVNKQLSDQYVFSEQYIDYLIWKISSGEYDPELLTDSERAQIEAKLKQEVK